MSVLSFRGSNLPANVPVGGAAPSLKNDVKTPPLSFELRLRRALDQEDPATAAAKIIGAKHPLFRGMLQAVRFERDYIDLKMSDVPPKALMRYNNYLNRCRKAANQKPQ